MGISIFYSFSHYLYDSFFCDFFLESLEEFWLIRFSVVYSELFHFFWLSSFYKIPKYYKVDTFLAVIVSRMFSRIVFLDESIMIDERFCEEFFESRFTSIGRHRYTVMKYWFSLSLPDRWGWSGILRWEWFLFLSFRWQSLSEKFPVSHIQRFCIALTMMEVE